MKTTTLILLFALFLGKSYAQEAESPKYFAQCMVNITSEQDFRDLETELRTNPYVQIVRLDWSTKRAFVLTKDIPSFSNETFVSWFGANGVNVSCIQTGVYGTDQIKPYPFENCPN